MLLSNRLDETQDKLGEAVETLEDISEIDPRFGSAIGRILEAIFQIDDAIKDSER